MFLPFCSRKRKRERARVGGLSEATKARGFLWILDEKELLKIFLNYVDT